MPEDRNAQSHSSPAGKEGPDVPSSPTVKSGDVGEPVVVFPRAVKGAGTKDAVISDVGSRQGSDKPPPGPDQPPPPPPPGPDQPPPPPPIPNRVSLFKLKGAEVFASLVGQWVQPWHLPVNGLVIPMGVQAGSYGAMAQALRAALGDPLWAELRRRIQDAMGKRIAPLKPVYVALDDPDLGRALLPNAPRPADGRPARYHVMAATVGSLKEVGEVRGVAQAVVETAAKEQVGRLALPMLGTGRGPFKDQGPQVAEYLVRGVYDALMGLAPGAMAEITLTTLDEKTFQAMQWKANVLINSLPQRLVSDQPAEQDLLGVADEAGALAEALLLREVEPPLAVGVLGGWGSGKTTVMNLMRHRMTEIRGLASPGWPEELTGWPDTPYVGHVYLIEFNAWTYAKSNLWASLMHRIFFELSRQLTLETQLADALAQVALDKEKAEKPGEAVDEKAREARREALKKEVLLQEDHQLWPALYAAGDEARSLLLQTEVGQGVVARWRSGDLATDALWAYLQERTQQEAEALNELRGKLAEACEKLAAQAVWEPTLTRLQAVLAGAAWERLRDQVGQEDANALEKLAAVTPGVLDSLKAAAQRPVETLAFLLFALVVAVVPPLLGQAAWRWPAWAVSAATLLAGGGRAFMRVQSALRDIRAEYRESVEAEQARLEAGEGRFLESPKLRALRQEVADLEGKVERQEQRVGLTSRHRSVYEFVRARLEEGFYEKQLGLMHRVESDLRDLTEALYIHPEDHYERVQQKRKLFPRGQPRVMLFIDDLDRCPPDKVVEVLEAVQLLLKTELFIVVLMLDTRYVTRALERAYAGILRPEGDPSGLDYIEKILTLSYRVQPVRGGAAAAFLEGLGLAVVAEEAGTGPATEPGRAGQAKGGPAARGGAPPRGTEAAGKVERLALRPAVITFTPEEYAAIATVCERIQLTPRGLKRIGNVMKLIRIFWHRTDMAHPPAVVQTAVALLALSARYPQVMRDAFVEMEVRCQEAGSATRTWHQFFEEFFQGHRARNQHLQAWGTQLMTDVKAIIPPEMTLAEIDLRTLDLARSFSFVADPTPTVEPAFKVEFVNEGS